MMDLSVFYEAVDWRTIDRSHTLDHKSVLLVREETSLQMNNILLFPQQIDGIII